MSENLADKGMHEHSKLIRESSEYRNFLMMEELRAEMQPSLSQEELPDSPPITDKNGIIGVGRGEGLLRGDFVKRGEFLYWQGKIIEHTAWHKEQAKKKAEKGKSIWINDGHEMDKV